MEMGKNDLTYSKQELPSENSIPQTSKKRSKKKVFIFLGIFILIAPIMILVGEFLGFISAFGFFKGGEAKDIPRNVQEVGPIIKMQPLTVNLKEESGRNYLRITVALEIGNKKFVDEVQSKMTQLTDLLITILCEKRLDDLKQPNFKEELKKEFLEKVTTHFPEGQIRQVLFEEFIYQ